MSTPQTNVAADDDLEKVIKAISAFHSVDHTMQAVTALCLLLIAKHQRQEGGLSTQDLANLLGSSKSTTSPNSMINTFLGQLNSLSMITRFPHVFWTVGPFRAQGHTF